MDLLIGRGIKLGTCPVKSRLIKTTYLLPVGFRISLRLVVRSNRSMAWDKDNLKSGINQYLTKAQENPNPNFFCQEYAKIGLWTERPSRILGPRYRSSWFLLGCSQRLTSLLRRSARILTNLEQSKTIKTNLESWNTDMEPWITIKATWNHRLL